MRIVVTGAAGFLGSAVCRSAAAAGHEVIGLVRPGELGAIVPAAHYEVLDWSDDARALARLLAEHHVQSVVHAAGATPRVTGEPAELYDANVRLVTTVLSAVLESGVDPTVVVVSTAGVYGPAPSVPTPEDAPLEPSSHYACSKAAMEDVARAFARLDGVQVCIARPFNLIGRGEPAGSVVSDVVRQLEAEPGVGEVLLRESVSVRDYVDVDDAAEALLLLADCGLAAETYNISSGRGVSVADLTAAILGVWESKAAVVVMDPAAAGTVSIGDASRLRALGWTPTTTLVSSLKTVREDRRDTTTSDRHNSVAVLDGRRGVALSMPVVGRNEYAYIDACLDSGWLASGAFITRFEDAVCELTGAKHTVACQSGTAAIQVTLQVAGVGRDDEVIVPALTFIATVNPVAYLGAHPVFVDCDDFMNMDPDAVAAFLESECERAADGRIFNRATGRRVAAVLPVHVFGNPCDIERLEALARDWGLPLVEDAAESLGATWTEGAFAGRHTGTVGRAGCLSFNGNKIITTGGGGMILTDDAAFAERARHLMTQAKSDPVRFVHDEVGYNYRMTNVQAAIGVAQLETLAERIDCKHRNRDLYAALLADVAGIKILGSPEGTAPNYWFYSALVDRGVFGMDREALMLGLAERGIQTRPVWRLNHLQEPYRAERACETPRAEWFWERVLNLPCTHTLSSDDIEFVCDAIRELGDR
ncbi:MAG: LegC family aminotransferase [Coriobacteriia bacterium]